MTQKEIFDKVVSLIRDYQPDMAHQDLTMETRVNTETSIDSMGFILLITKLEAAYQISFSDRQMTKILTIGDLVTAIQRKLAKKA
jgi:acyl carrier protein